MATGGSEECVDSRVVCSVCLEHYRGRQPKLLPCFHTFCLPCLSQLAEANTQSQTSSGATATPQGEDATGCPAPTITCPTCRTVIPVPPGGVQNFQANFYVDQDAGSPLQRQSPSSASSTAMSTAEDDDLQEKVKTQVKVLQAVLIRLSEEEEEITRQSRATDHGIQTRYAAALRHMGDARDQCLISLRDAVQAEQDKLEFQRSLTELKLENLQNSRSKHVALLKGGVFRHFQQLAHKSEAKNYFSYNPPDTLTSSLIDSMAQFMGTVVPFGQTPDLNVRANKLPEGVDADYAELLNNANLRHDVTTLLTEMEKLRQSLQADQEKLKQEVAVLQTESGQHGQDITAMGEENVRLVKEVHGVQSEISRQQADVSKLDVDMAAVHKDLANLQAEAKRLVTDMGNIQTDNKKLVTDMATTNRPVAFHAVISRNSGKKKDRVVTNVGGGYDPNTGIFTAPVSGVYVFMATAHPGGRDKSCFMIMVESQRHGWSVAFNDNSSTGHVVVEVTAGQKVWMQSEGQDYFFDMNRTYFSGVLVQAKLQ